MVMPTFKECRHCGLSWFSCSGKKLTLNEPCCTYCRHSVVNCVGETTTVTNQTQTDSLIDMVLSDQLKTPTIDRERYDVGEQVTPQEHAMSVAKCELEGHAWTAWYWAKYQTQERRLCERCGLKENRNVS